LGAWGNRLANEEHLGQIRNSRLAEVVQKQELDDLGRRDRASPAANAAALLLLLQGGAVLVAGRTQWRVRISERGKVPALSTSITRSLDRGRRARGLAVANRTPYISAEIVEDADPPGDVEIEPIEIADPREGSEDPVRGAAGLMLGGHRCERRPGSRERWTARSSSRAWSMSLREMQFTVVSVRDSLSSRSTREGGRRRGAAVRRTVFD
jgi:hypothetical protein